MVGGTSVSEELNHLTETGANIIVGTPGRLNQFLSNFTNTSSSGKGIMSTTSFEVLILDEADRLLDMGFEVQLNNIIKRLPKQRRTGLFSATMTDAVGDLVKAGLRNPVRIVLSVRNAGEESQRTPSSLEIKYVVCSHDEKLSKLMLFLRNGVEKAIMYFSTCACVDYYFKVFSKIPELKKFQILSLHGKMDAKKREGIYQKFTTNHDGPQILLCTDVAARGLDIPDVDYVIQFDPPQDPKAFAHRCGRTARSGRAGSAIVFLGPHETVYVDFLRIRKIPMSRVDLVNGVIVPVSENNILEDDASERLEMLEKLDESKQMEVDDFELDAQMETVETSNAVWDP
ncbi:ATP-dependent RNA helicase ddx55, partial [Nowakowskiella sp. JEL0078]